MRSGRWSTVRPLLPLAALVIVTLLTIGVRADAGPSRGEVALVDEFAQPVALPDAAP
jgi:hypothetical protein